MIYDGSIPSYGCNIIYLTILPLVEIRVLFSFLLAHSASLILSEVGHILRSRTSFSRDRYLAFVGIMSCEQPVVIWYQVLGG